MGAGSEKRGWGRHFDGWQAGALVLLLAAPSMLLATPHAVVPTELPLPRVDMGALRATMHADDERAAEAQKTQLDVYIRSVGREMRAYNAAAAAFDESALLASRARLVKAASKALAFDEVQLLRLRAFQMGRFLVELRHWVESGEVTRELAELGGDFVATLKRNAWCRGGGRELLMGESVLRALFKKRFNDIIGVRGPAFDLSADENRVRFRFFLQHPLQHRTDLRPSAPAAQRAKRAKNQLTSIGRLQRLDPSYPADLARGIVRFQGGQFAQAAAAFRAHLERRPDGPYTLRARNHLKAALEMARR